MLCGLLWTLLYGVVFCCVVLCLIITLICYWYHPYCVNHRVTGGTFDPRKPIPIDGFDVWNTISRGGDSPRTEILHNIDNRPLNGSMLGNFQGMALRMGGMKLLMNVNNITWFKPPELGGEFPEELLSNGLVTEESDEDVLAALMENYLVSNLRGSRVPIFPFF